MLNNFSFAPFDRLRVTLQYLYFGIFLIPIIWNPWAGNEMYETAKVAWVLLFTAAALIYAAAALYREKHISISGNKTLFAILALMLASFGLSTIFSISPIESFWGLYKRQQGLFIILVYVLHFLIFLHLLRQEKFKKAFLGITLFSGIIVAVYAIAQKFGFDPFIKGEIPLFAGRSLSSMGSPNSLGQFLIFPWWVALVFLIDNLKTRRYGWSATHVVFFVLVSFALYFSFNRASMLGIGIAAIIFAAHKIQGKRPKIAAAVFCLILAVFGLMYFSNSWLSSAKLTAIRSLGSRAVLWNSAMPLVQKYPVLGLGPETVYQTIQTALSPEIYKFERMLDTPDRIHNVFLEALLTRGALGMAVLLLTMGFILWIALKKEFTDVYAETSFFALAAYFISIQFGFSVVTHMVFWTAFAALFFANSMGLKDFRIKMPKTVAATACTVLLVVSFLVLDHGFKLIKTEYLVKQGLLEFLAGKPNAAETFNKAQNTLPYFREIPYMALSLLSEEARKNPQALEVVKASAEQIEKVAPQSFYAPLAKAQIYNIQNDYQNAAAEFEKAATLAPNWPGIWYKWGNSALKAGEKQAALRAFQRFIELAPRFTTEEKDLRRIFEKSNPAWFEVTEMLKVLSTVSSRT